MRRAFRDMADDSRTERQPFSANAQPAAAFDHLADDVFISVLDLFRIAILVAAEMRSGRW